MKAKWCITPLLAALVLTFATSCITGGGGNNPTRKTNKALMGLSIGMTKGQVYELVGTAAKIEGYDWGSVWFYRVASGGGVSGLPGSNDDEDFTPVVFDNSNRVTGYGGKFYNDTIRELGTGTGRF